jgi:hypothetical protein
MNVFYKKIHVKLKDTSINCLRSLRDLKRVAARREPQHNGYSIVKVHNAADAGFRSRPAGLYTRFRLRVTLLRQAMSLTSKAWLQKRALILNRV